MSVNTFRLKSNVDVIQRPKHLDLLVQGRLCSSFCDFTPFLQHTLRHLAASHQMDISHARHDDRQFLLPNGMCQNPLKNFYGRRTQRFKILLIISDFLDLFLTIMVICLTWTRDSVRPILMASSSRMKISG